VRGDADATVLVADGAVSVNLVSLYRARGTSERARCAIVYEKVTLLILLPVVILVVGRAGPCEFFFAKTKSNFCFCFLRSVCHGSRSTESGLSVRHIKFPSLLPLIRNSPILFRQKLFLEGQSIFPFIFIQSGKEDDAVLHLQVPHHQAGGRRFLRRHLPRRRGEWGEGASGSG
jgi:hypothetical protein